MSENETNALQQECAGKKLRRREHPKRRAADYLDFEPPVSHPLGATLGPAAIAPRRNADPLVLAEIVRLLEGHGVNWSQAVREVAGLFAVSIEYVEEWWAFDACDHGSPSEAEMIAEKRFPSSRHE